MIDRLREVMRRLRDPDTGCAWDAAQTFETIAPYTIEEAYEVADAIARGDMDELKDELGDLQLQVVFHSAIAESRGAFTLDDVIEAICDKLVRRHPHVFGDGPSPGWEALKAEERSTRPDASALAGVAQALPALMRADKIQRRAARTGFDWPDEAGARDKLIEEIGEVDRAGDPTERMDEMGDLLFAAVNWARHLGVDPETALAHANRKFERRFRRMEALATDDFAGLLLDRKEALWCEVKAEERRG